MKTEAKETNMERRTFLLSSLLTALAADRAEASPIDPKQTFVLQHNDISFSSCDGLPPHSGEMAKLYGDFNKPGPYLILMKWNPGWFSARRTAARRIASRWFCRERGGSIAAPISRPKWRLRFPPGDSSGQPAPSFLAPRLSGKGSWAMLIRPERLGVPTARDHGRIEQNRNAC